MNNKRLSLSYFDVCHLYELALQNFQKGCPDCVEIKKRMEKFIGKKQAKWVEDVVKKFGY